MNGYHEVVNFLITVDPSVAKNYVIGTAAGNGHVEVVKYLLTDKRVDPSAGQKTAVQLAA